MPDMLVLKRDRRSGDLKMLVEIDPSPVPAWQPGALPIPNWHDPCDPVRYDESDVDYYLDAVEAFVADMDLYPLEVTRVHWESLREDLSHYVR
jgi:hypothetical protein